MEGTWRVEHQMLEVCVQCDVKDLWIKNEDFWCRLLCLCVVFWIWKAWSRHRAATSHQSGHLRRIRQPTTRSASVNTRNPAPPPSPLRITSHMCNRRWKSVKIDEKGKNSTKTRILQQSCICAKTAGIQNCNVSFHLSSASDTRS